jgi:hypothetical protein
LLIPKTKEKKLAIIISAIIKNIISTSYTTPVISKNVNEGINSLATSCYLFSFFLILDSYCEKRAKFATVIISYIDGLMFL